MKLMFGLTHSYVATRGRREWCARIYGPVPGSMAISDGSLMNVKGISTTHPYFQDQ